MERWVPAENHRLQQALSDTQQETDGNNRHWEEKEYCFRLMDAIVLRSLLYCLQKELTFWMNSLNPYYILDLERHE